MPATMPYAYGSQRKTIDELRATATWRNTHPEVRRRFEAMFEASNWTVGVGTAWRDPRAQDAERARRIRTGTGAQMAPSANSWHCAGGAVDIVGNQHWAKDNCHLFGLYYATWAGESLWHQQPDGLPHARPSGASVEQFIGHAHIQGAPAPQPHPPAPDTFPAFDPCHGLFSLWPFATDKPFLQVGAHHEAAKYLQGVLKNKAGQPITVCDGIYGRQTMQAVINAQRYFKLTVDGKVGAQTWRLIDELAGQ
jgi:Putative peptidoglycan binding domain